MTYDIAASNQRQSDFYQGWEDAEDGKPPRKPENDDYMRGYCANAKAFRWSNRRRVESFSNTTTSYRRLEDLKDRLASIEDNGELYPGEEKAVRAAIEDMS